jgi:uncharacterized membrane protein
MTKLVIWVVVGLLLGLATHLATLLALPNLATRTAIDRLAALGTGSGFRILPAPSPGQSVLPAPDPSLRLAVCRYDLTAGPVRIRAPLTPGFLSVSFYTLDGLNYYALTDRAASEGTIELTIYTSLQLAEVRAREGPDTPEALRLEAPAPAGLVVLRALVPHASLLGAIESRIGEAQCTPATDAPRGAGEDDAVTN